MLALRWSIQHVTIHVSDHSVLLAFWLLWLLGLSRLLRASGLAARRARSSKDWAAIVLGHEEAKRLDCEAGLLSEYSSLKAENKGFHFGSMWFAF